MPDQLFVALIYEEIVMVNAIKVFVHDEHNFLMLEFRDPANPFGRVPSMPERRLRNIFNRPTGSCIAVLIDEVVVRALNELNAFSE